MSGCQSTMDRPDCVSRVIPPITTVANVAIAMLQNQIRKRRRAGSETRVRQPPVGLPAGSSGAAGTARMGHMAAYSALTAAAIVSASPFTA